jgi:hypothetical protein
VACSSLCPTFMWGPTLEHRRRWPSHGGSRQRIRVETSELKTIPAGPTRSGGRLCESRAQALPHHGAAHGPAKSGRHPGPAIANLKPPCVLPTRTFIKITQNSRRQEFITETHTPVITQRPPRLRPSMGAVWRGGWAASSRRRPVGGAWDPGSATWSSSKWADSDRGGGRRPGAGVAMQTRYPMRAA